jgi:hypothetical protein
MPTTPVAPADVQVGDIVTIVAKVIRLFGRNAVAAGPEFREIIVALDRVTDGVTFTREQPGSPEWPGPGVIGWARLGGLPEFPVGGYTTYTDTGKPVFRSVTGVSHSWDVSITAWTQAVHPDGR